MSSGVPKCAFKECSSLRLHFAGACALCRQDFCEMHRLAEQHECVGACSLKTVAAAKWISVTSELASSVDLVVGTLTPPGGFRYAGEMLRVGIPEGRGVLTYPDKNRYEGSFHLKPRHSSVLSHHAASEQSLEFTAVGSRRHGINGTFTWADGSKYEGEWRDNCLHGRGVLTMTDGRMFSGRFRSNVPEDGVLEDGTESAFMRFDEEDCKDVDLLQSRTLPEPKSVRVLGRIPAPLHMAITNGAAPSYHSRGASALSIADRIQVKAA